jgi:muconolactone D-isomerase
MLFHVRMDVHIPAELDAQHRADLIAREKAYCQDLQQAGKWPHIWRVVGEYANFSIFDVESNDELHQLVSALPLFDYLDIDVTPHRRRTRQLCAPAGPVRRMNRRRGIRGPSCICRAVAGFVACRISGTRCWEKRFARLRPAGESKCVIAELSTCAGIHLSAGTGRTTQLTECNPLRILRHSNERFCTNVPERSD